MFKRYILHATLINPKWMRLMSGHEINTFVVALFSFVLWSNWSIRFVSYEDSDCWTEQFTFVWLKNSRVDQGQNSRTDIFRIVWKIELLRWCVSLAYVMCISVHRCITHKIWAENYLLFNENRFYDALSEISYISHFEYAQIFRFIAYCDCIYWPITWFHSVHSHYFNCLFVFIAANILPS